jgi:hypothetical protein
MKRMLVALALAGPMMTFASGCDVLATLGVDHPLTGGELDVLAPDVPPPPPPPPPPPWTPVDTK